MPYVTPDRLAPSYDVVIVGSGAAGGQAAYTLAMEGAKVLMLEAGRYYDPQKETPMFQTEGEAPLRGAGTPDKPLFFYDATVDGGWAVPGEPYTQGSSDPAKRFMWWRSRMLGGRTNHWGRTAQRMGEYDFKPRTRQGLGEDWPIGYPDLAPYYDKVELLIGVYGTNEGIENVPDSAPGCLLPAPKPRLGEMLVRQRVRPLGLGVYAAHRAVLSQRLDHVAIPARLHPNNPMAQRILAREMQSRAACLWATVCPRGCSIKANYQSTTVHLPPALATGNLDIVTGAMVREVALAPDGRARGLVFIDKKSGREYRADGKVVVLAAGSYESVRLLLNSKSARFPQGLANSSGELGRHLMDSVSTSLDAQIPALESLPPFNEDGAGGEHVYVPWWGYADQKSGKLDFPGGYEILFASGRHMPGAGIGGSLDRIQPGNFGRQFKSDMRRYYGSFLTLKGEGRMIPNEKSFCEIDPARKDRWGIPVLRFHWEWSDYEFRQAAHMQKTFAAMFAAMGAKLTQQPDLTGRSLLPGGHLKHETGGARMGADRSKSVTNQWGQTWDVKNLFIADGSLFAANSEKAATLTILALAWRTADRIHEEMKKGNL